MFKNIDKLFLFKKKSENNDLKLYCLYMISVQLYLSAHIKIIKAVKYEKFQM